MLGSWRSRAVSEPQEFNAVIGPDVAWGRTGHHRHLHHILVRHQFREFSLALSPFADPKAAKSLISAPLYLGRCERRSKLTKRNVMSNRTCKNTAASHLFSFNWAATSRYPNGAVE